MIPYGRQSISDKDIDAVIEVLRSDFITQGPLVQKFEEAVLESCKAKYAVSANSATSALHLACLALGVGPGDEVWTSPITFVASANCALYCGAKTDFVDIDPLTLNMSAEALRTKLDDRRKNNKPLPKAVIPVHFGGQSCDMSAIGSLSKEYGFAVIEDAAHAIGGQYDNLSIGSCQHSDICVFSFHPVKIITTGEGGMAVTQNADLAATMASLRSHGITRDPAEMTKATEGPWYYQQIALGYNYRLTDIQAALGLSQMSRLKEFVYTRNELASRYDRAFSGSRIYTQKLTEKSESARHLYVIRVPSTIRTGMFETLRTNGVGVNLHYIPVYFQPYYQNLGFSKGLCPEAEKYYEEAISLPMYPDLSTDDQDYVISTVKAALDT